MYLWRHFRYGVFFMYIIIGLLTSPLSAETLYIDSRCGSDTNPGSKEKPLQTIAKAAELINNKTIPGPTIIKIEAGTYNLSKCVLLKNDRPYTETNRLTIEASILPDDPNWLPKFMPVILSTEPPSKTVYDTYKYSADNATIGLKVEISHVTIRGLKFLGNPAEHTWHYPVFREGDDLTDLVVTQCLFVGDKHTLSYLSPICAKGHKIIADHCIFYNCHTPLIFWDAKGGISNGCAVRYCIIDGAVIAAVWLTQTAEDFEFHHNIITRSNYVWMRGRKNQKKYHLHDSVITDCKYDSGYGNAYEIYGQTGPEISYTEDTIIKNGTIQLQQDEETFDKGIIPAKNRPKEYLHPTRDSAGYHLNTGLFKVRQNPGKDMPALSQSVAVTEELSVKTILKGVYLVTHQFPFGGNSLAVEMKDGSLVLVDTPYTPEATKELIDWFETKLGKRKIIAINTGYHWDNLGGNGFLVKEGIAVYGSDLTAKLLKERAVQAHAQTLKILDKPDTKRFADALKDLPFTAPSHTFKLQEGLKLDFGGETLQVYYPGPSHTLDNVVVYLPDRKVLFGGCMVIGFGKLGNIAEADMKTWPQSLRKLKQFDADIVIPGHGNLMYPDLIEETIDILETANSKRSN